MVLDNDVAGIIAASCFLFVFIVIFTICLAWRCTWRLQREKKRQAVKNWVKESARTTRDGAAKEKRSGRSVSASETASTTHSKMGGYRPKIFGKEDEESNYAAISRDGSNEKESKKRMYKKRIHKQSQEIIEERSTKPVANGKAVSVVYVNGESSTPSGYTRETRIKRPIVEGLIKVPYASSESQRSSSEIVHGHIVHQDNDYFNRSYSVQQNGGGGELVHGHHVTSRGSEMVRGYVIKENVVRGEDGNLYVSSSQKRDLGETVHGHMSRQSKEVTTIVTPSGGEIIRARGQVFKQNVEMGADGNLVVTSSEQREFDTGANDNYAISNPQIVHGQIELETEENNNTAQQELVRTRKNYIITEPEVVRGQIDFERDHSSFTRQDSDGPQIVHGHQSSEQHDSYEVKRSVRRDVHGLVIAEEHQVDGWKSAADEAIEALHNDAVPDIVVTSDDAEGGRAKRQESVSDFYNDKTKLKVIKKHSSHKPPDWLIETYAEEAGEGRERRDSSTQVEHTFSSDEYFSKNVQKVTFNEVSTEIQDAEIVHNYNYDNDYDDNNDGQVAEIVRSTSQIDQEYPDGGRGTYIVTEYADPEMQSHRATRTYMNTEDTDRGTSTTWMSTSSMTSSSMRKVRQEVNESAEKIPPAFTSTPRAPWETQGSETTFMVTGSETHAPDTDNRRQRDAYASAVEDLPPTYG